MILQTEEAITYVGGAKISAALLSAATNLCKYLYEVGQNFGSAIKRLFTKTSC